MSKKLILVFAMVALFSRVSLANAQVRINEFLVNGEPEWVELLNTTDAEVFLTGWSIADAVNPAKSLDPLGSISPHGIVVYDNFTNWLNNTGSDSITLRNSTSTTVDQVLYGNGELAAPGIGKSAALISNTWKTNQEPTKGEANPSSGPSSDNDEEDNSDENNDAEDNGSQGNSGSSSSKESAPPKIYKTKVEIISGSVAHVGVPFFFEGTGTGKTGAKISHGRYYWNFGDGDYREVKVPITEKFTHTYFYPGEYSVTLDYYPDYFADEPEATDQVNIKVIEPNIIISRVGEANDFFVEITNETGNNANISGWVLLSAYKAFIFPKNTVLGPKKKMMISPKLSGFTIGDKSTLRLMTAERELVHDLSMGKPAPRKVQSSTRRPSVSNEGGNEAEREAGNFLPGESLPALALGASDEGSSDEDVPPWMTFGGLMVFLGGAGFSAYKIRQKKASRAIEDDFEILDE